MCKIFGALENKKKSSHLFVQNQAEPSSNVTINENGEKQTQYQMTPDLSDCGYGTHPESTSITSSEDHPSQNFHSKPQRFHGVKKPCKVISAQEQKDRRRKKLVKRSKSNL